MIYLDDCKDKCFADIAGQCIILAEPATVCNAQCPFYKPRGCGDWVRIITDERAVIIPPEENKRRYEEYEQECKHKSLYWCLKRVPKG